MAKVFSKAELAKNVGHRMAEDDRPSSDKLMISLAPT
jgi:hypothetical protein